MKFRDLVKGIDEEWIKENPKTMLDLFELMSKELDRRKEVIQMKNKEVLLLSTLLNID